MTEARRALILGRGEMGHAMVSLLSARHTLTVWERRPKGGRAAIDLEDAVEGAEAVFFCVPAAAHGELAARIAPHLADGAWCISIAKGVDAQGRCAWRIFQDEIGTGRNFGVIYGPMISEEIRAGKPAFADVATTDGTGFDWIHKLFSGSGLYLRPSNDPLGISWCAILKNVYAIAFGVADALALGDNLRGHLAVAAADEISAISRRLGGSPEAAYRDAGLGDLITTATSQGSHHRALGGYLVGEQLDKIVGEGVNTLKTMGVLQLINNADYPLFDLIHQAVLSPRDTSVLFRRYLLGGDF